MKIMRKSRVTQAVAAAVFAAGLSAGVQAAPVVNESEVGDALLFPYYTTENGFNTLVHIVNTNSSHTVIAKVRLREQVASADVLDFTVILSPNDVFTGYVRNGSNGPEFVKTDNSCTSPNVAKGSPIAFTSTTNLTTGVTGHIEVLTEAVIHNATFDSDGVSTTNRVLERVVNGALHNSAGVPGNCADVDTLFASGTNGITALQAAIDDPVGGDGWTIGTPATLVTNEATADNDGDGNVNNAQGTNQDHIIDTLTGHYALLDAANGVAAANRPIVVSGAFNNNAGQDIINSCGGGVAQDHLVCGQFNAHFPYPNFANVIGMITEPRATARTAASQVANVAAFNALANAVNGGFTTGIHNEWSANTANGVKSEYVITFPLKHVYADNFPVALDSGSLAVDSLDVFAQNSQSDSDLGTFGTQANQWDDVDAALNDLGNWVVGGAGIVGNFGAANGGNGNFVDATGCVNYNMVNYDREEDDQTVASTTTASGPQTSSAGQTLCNEVNVLTFGGGVTNPSTATAISTAGLNQLFGWSRIGFRNETAGANTTAANLSTSGHAMWTRQFTGGSRANFSQMIGHGRM